MGRKKVKLKRIENKSSRQITFSKRRNGLFKKAREFSVLCGIQVSPLIFSSRGRLFEFSSVGSLAKILKRHRSHIEEKTVLSKGANDVEVLECRYIVWQKQMQLMLELINALHDKEKALREENQLLETRVIRMNNLRMSLR